MSLRWWRRAAGGGRACLTEMASAHKNDCRQAPARACAVCVYCACQLHKTGSGSSGFGLWTMAYCLQPCDGGAILARPVEPRRAHLGSFDLVAAFTHALPALVWAVVAQSSWSMVRNEKPQSRFFRLLP